MFRQRGGVNGRGKGEGFSSGSIVAEVDPEAAEVFGVFFEAVVLGPDVFLLEEFEDAFPEDTGPFAGDDFDEGNFFVACFSNNVVEGGFNPVAPVEDVVEVEGELGHGNSGRILQ